MAERLDGGYATLDIVRPERLEGATYSPFLHSVRSQQSGSSATNTEIGEAPIRTLVYSCAEPRTNRQK